MTYDIGSLFIDLLLLLSLFFLFLLYKNQK
jgi:hypothetical protein